MARAWIGLGANLGNPAAQVRDAVSRIAQLPGVQLLAQSRLYRSAPLGPPGTHGPQDDYCNAVCAVATALLPGALLTQLHAIERAMGRVRPPVRWAPRLIDLDLLHYAGVKLRTARLVLPHPELQRRNFVAAPLAEIAPQLELPGLGPARRLAQTLGESGLTLWNQA